MCDGALLSISENSALFSILGTTYGGDGISTFALPDLRGRVAVHPGSGPGLTRYSLGERGGAEQTTLITSQLPSHSHTLSATNQPADQASPEGNLLASQSSSSGIATYADGSAEAAMSASAISHTGGGLPVALLQPFGCVNFIIAKVGIYPSRE